MSRLSTILLLLVFSAGTVGCDAQSNRRRLSRPPEPVTKVDHIDILSMPAALNFDHRPGPDGVRVTVYLYRLDRPEPVTIEGTLELMVYEEKVSPSDLHTREPFHVWRFGPEKLARQLFRGIVGWGYAMDLHWGTRGPRSRTISLVARYLPPEGPDVYSDPVVIAMNVKQTP